MAQVKAHTNWHLLKVSKVTADGNQTELGDCIADSFLSELVMPPVAASLRNYTNHTVQGGLLQTLLLLNISKRPPLAIKLFGTCGLEGQKGVYQYPTHFSRSNILHGWCNTKLSAMDFLFLASDWKSTIFPRLLPPAAAFYSTAPKPPVTPRTFLAPPHPPVPSLAPLPHGPASFI